MKKLFFGFIFLLSLWFVSAPPVLDEIRPPSISAIRRTKVAVVFGGGESRVDAVLRLFEQNLISRVYFSGEDFDFYPGGFVDFFSLRGHDKKVIERFLECCVEWDNSAKDTLENASDIACWVSKKEIKGPILMITSSWHMRRALMLISDQLRKNEIVAYPIESDSPDESEEERRKFAITFWVLRPLAWLGFYRTGSCL